MPHRRWSLADFAIVLHHPDWTAAELARSLPPRRPSEIKALRAAIHVHHTNDAEEREAARQVVLTEPLCAYLGQRELQQVLTCAWCGATFGGGQRPWMSRGQEPPPQ